VLEHPRRQQGDSGTLRRRLRHGQGGIEHKAADGRAGQFQRGEPARPFIGAVGVQQGLPQEVAGLPSRRARAGAQSGENSFGGPAGLTVYLRSLGDDVTRLDRRETELHEATPGGPRDTTTLAAMLEALRKTVLGTALSAASRVQLRPGLSPTGPEASGCGLVCRQAGGSGTRRARASTTRRTMWA
jgi:hypothetical protein